MRFYSNDGSTHKTVIGAWITNFRNRNVVNNQNTVQPMVEDIIIEDVQIISED